MGAQKGRNYLVQLETSTGVFSNIGGLREPSITVNNEPVDISNADDSGIRKLLEGGGLTSLSIKAQGVYIDNQYLGTLRDAALANTHLSMAFVIPGEISQGSYKGQFMVTQFEEAATYNQTGTYNLTLESAGAVAFA